MTLVEALRPNGTAVSKAHGVMVVRHSWHNKHSSGNYYRVHHFTGRVTKQRTLLDVLHDTRYVATLGWQPA